MYKVWQHIFKILGILALLGSVIAVIWLFQLGILNDDNLLAQTVENHPMTGFLIFILVQIIQVVFPIIPGGVTTVVGFLTFRFWLGFLYNFLGIFIGSLILFTLVRIYGKKFILLFTSEATFDKYERRLDTKNYERFFILTQIIPFMPADIMLMITGLSKMSYRRLIGILLWTKPLSILSFSYLWIYGGKILQKLLGN
ncbi:TVP38/TMEM64 family protein [Streptococcus sp. DD12]|uniref:TVP38/TMEM64 family protein n=1 Tax=Streptococcus sp. DD12 TaxID=1777880 RepID=UPI00079AE354|nr:VTT domain-containing protein [Streptococcus sp. DD12]KXT76389.1 Immunoreactive protein Se23.5 [Streptococcus sp. DD12]